MRIMKELLLLKDGVFYVRTLSNSHDEFNMFPRHSYSDREATKEDVKKLAPGLFEKLK